MKKYAIVAFVLVLTVSMLTGCGCTAQDTGMTTMPSAEPTILPTNIPETTVPTEPATEFMTDPATEVPDGTDSTETDGMNGDSQDIPAETGSDIRSRMR